MESEELRSEASEVEVLAVRGMKCSEVYDHLFALCNNSDEFGFVKYEHQTDQDLERLVVLDARKLIASGMTRGSIIGSLRLLPAGNDTVIQFVHKDVFWFDLVINPDLWRRFRHAVKAYFAGLQMIHAPNTHIIPSEVTLGKPDRQAGRYRLTPTEIKTRRKKVKEAEKLRRLDAQKTWKQIAAELNMAERTLRDWRHNPTYQ